MYAHGEIHNETIRLLRLSTGPEKNGLYFGILVFRRQTAPAYLALSYTWGDQTATESIYLDNEHFPIRPNLKRALESVVSLMRRNFMNGINVESTSHDDVPATYEHLWVDALCIDQTNVPERNDQVRRMGDTFFMAGAVFSWLGGRDHTTLASSDRCEVARILENTHGNWVRLAEWTKAQNELIFDLLHDSYWSRSWTVQEYMLGHNNIIISPDLCINAEDFARIFAVWKAIFTKATPAAVFLSMKERPFPTLGQVLYNYGHCDCLDPRDRIFSMLSIAHAGQVMPLRQYLPNYALSYDEVLVVTLATLLGSELESFARLDDVKPLLSRWSLSWDSTCDTARAFAELCPSRSHVEKYGQQVDQGDGKPYLQSLMEYWSKDHIVSTELTRTMIATAAEQAQRCKLEGTRFNDLYNRLH